MANAKQNQKGLPLLRIAVIGCGMTGPAAGLALARLGHRVEIFEQAPEPAPVGAGFLLQPPGLAVLNRLGIGSSISSLGSPISQLFCKTKAGRTLLDLSYQEIQPDIHALGLHRPYLLDAFLNAMSDESIPVHWATPCQGMTKNTNGWTLELTNKSSPPPFDLVVVADGAASRLRAATGIPHRVSHYPWGALWFIGEDRNDDFDDEVLYQIVDGTEILNGFLPTGRTAEGTRQVSLFWSLQHERLDEIRKGGIDSWREHILSMTPQAETLLSQINDFDDLAIAHYHDVVADRLYGDGVVLLGDAAHAMSPQLGQGVNLGLVDAEVLADAMASARDLPTALADFDHRRRAHLRFYQFATRSATPFFQSSHQPLGALRDLAFPIAQYLPYARKEMVRTMMGVKTGVLPWQRLKVTG